jgi:3-methyladenine DNA glycosylase/8-oxoguanine DNA glycosylase
MPVKDPRVLEAVHVKELFPTAPFHFDASMHKPDHFPSKDNEYTTGLRWQTMLWQGHPLGLKFENRGTIDRPAVHLSIWSHENIGQDFFRDLVAEINYRYNFKFDLREFNQKYNGDPQLGPVIDKWRGMRPLSCSSLYENLIIAIVLQNATVRRSVSMMQALFQNYGTLLSYDDRELYCFWEPGVVAHISEQELRGLKIGYRAKSIKRISEDFSEKVIDEFELRDKSVEEQREALLKLYGIGPASVWYILFDVFHQFDELDHISPWEQRIYSKLFFGGDPEKPVEVKDLLELFDERFGQYKMLAIHYIWEDLFWKRQNENIAWLEKMIRL